MVSDLTAPEGVPNFAFRKPQWHPNPGSKG